MVLEKLLRIPWTARRSNHSILRGIGPGCSLEGESVLGVEAETLILWPPDSKNWLIGKDPDAGKDWRLEEKGTTEVEMVGWHHWLNGHEFESTLGVGDGQGGLSCCSPQGCKELNTAEQLNWTDVLSMIISRSIHVAADGIILFNGRVIIPLYICTTYFWSIHPLLDI